MLSCSLPPLLPPRSHCPSLLHSIDRFDLGLMGSYHPELDGTRCHVLVLLPERSWHQDLVEGVDHPSPNHPICY